MGTGTSARRRRSAALLLATAALLAAGCGSSSGSAGTGEQAGGVGATAPGSSGATTSTGSAAPSQIGFEGVPLEQGAPLASAATSSPGTPVDGVRCNSKEQLAYHIHAHLQVYVDGQPRSLPGGIGLVRPFAQQTAYGLVFGATNCYYWLHTHASDGVIHIESPDLKLYTLGDFFDEWRQPLSSDDVAGIRGKVTAFINGQRWRGSPRSLRLLPHAVIQLDVGAPVIPFAPISWAGTGL